MICCSKCFDDIEIKQIIEGLNRKGRCMICGCTDSFVYDTDSDTELVIFFDELISIYTPSHLLLDMYPKADLKLLKDELLDKWSIFNKLCGTQAYNIVTCICKEKYKEFPELFDNPIGIAESIDLDYLNKKSMLKTNKWEDFVNALKTENRFHTNHINIDILRLFCSYIRKPYKKGTILYRGRISPSNGYDKDLMTAPPSDLVSAGRANSMGVRCLYLADNVETTIREVRAGAFDYVSIGAFELQEDIIVVNLKSIDRISPFIVDLDCTQHAINKVHLKKINKEMGKVLRRNDSPLDYIPTQYISDFIKSIEHNGIAEYAGLEYDSTMNMGGYNLAIFYPDLFKCINVDTYKIEDLYYKKEKVSK